MERFSITKAVAVGLCLFLLGVFIGISNNSFGAASRSNLRSAANQEKQPSGRGDGVALPAYMEARQLSGGMAMFPSINKDKDETEQFVWRGTFARESFQSFDTDGIWGESFALEALQSLETYGDWSYSFSFSFDFDA